MNTPYVVVGVHIYHFLQYTVIIMHPTNACILYTFKTMFNGQGYLYVYPFRYTDVFCPSLKWTSRKCVVLPRCWRALVRAVSYSYVLSDPWRCDINRKKCAHQGASAPWEHHTFLDGHFKLDQNICAPHLLCTLHKYMYSIHL